MNSGTILSVEYTVTAQAPIKDVYDRWSRFEEFPSFMEGVKELKQLDEKRFNLVSEACGNLFVSVCEITLRIPERRIAWRTLSGPDSSGVVCFQNAGHGQTEVTLKMRYDPTGAWEDQEQVVARLQRNLRRFKDLIERTAPADAH